MACRMIGAAMNALWSARSPLSTVSPVLSHSGSSLRNSGCVFVGQDRSRHCSVAEWHCLRLSPNTDYFVRAYVGPSRNPAGGVVVDRGMYIHVDTAAEPPVARLADRDNFRAFAIMVDGTPDQLPAVADALTGLGAVDADGEHAMLDADAVRRLAGATDGDAWTADFDAMVEYARSKGWTDDQGRVRAHLEWRTG